MIIYIDIDETICEYINSDRDYSKAIPIVENITKVNNLYDNGHKIIFWTARGTVTGIDWSDITKKQLHDWGVKYNELKFGKPVYDLFIDDKCINSIWDWNNSTVEKFYQ